MGRPATLKVEIVADAKGASKGVQQADRDFGKLGGKLGGLSKLGGPVGLALGAIATAAGAAAVASVKAASDLEQNMGAVETVFGKAADTVKAYGSQAATTVGLSKAEYAGLAAAVGTSMQNIGKSEAEAAKSTDLIIARAADLAATFGGTTKDATEALGAAFRGEFDSVERLGISLRQSDISAELARRGQEKLTGQALKNAQGQATLDLIMRQTNKTQGAFGRESDTLAGQQQRLKAQFDNLKAAIGARLIPVLVRLAQWTSERLLPALRRLGDFVRTRLWPVYQSYLNPLIEGARKGFAAISNAVNKNRGDLDKLRPGINLLGRVISKVLPIIGKVWGKEFEIVLRVIGLAISGLGRLLSTTESVAAGFRYMRDQVQGAVSAVRDSVNTIGGLIDKIPGFSVQVTQARPDLVGGVGGMGLGPAIGLATAAYGDPLAYSLGAGAGRSSVRPAGRTTVNMPITINGALDPVAVARQLERVLRDASVRLGRTASYGPAWA